MKETLFNADNEIETVVPDLGPLVHLIGGVLG